MSYILDVWRVRYNMMLLVVLMIFSFVMISYAMIGYPMLLLLLEKIKKPAACAHNYEYQPKVTYMIVAHNEEKSIRAKLENILSFDYPMDKMQILVASDNSTDSTNHIVEQFARSNPQLDILLHITKEHKGKTNAQNEAQRKAVGEILIMTDANTIIAKDAVKEIVSSFTDQEIVYVCGKLVYTNSEEKSASNSESTYWSLDLKMRDIESRIQTITAGNGALYACRNSEYIEIEPIFCHDLTMPYYYAKQKKRAIFCPTAVAYEKAGESNQDEFKRKVRMNRDILTSIGNGFKCLNPFKYQWFSVFYFGHRTCRYLLWMFHLIFFVCSMLCMNYNWLFGGVVILLQIIWIMLSMFAISREIPYKIIRFACYYGITILAQYVGVWRVLTGKAKPVWEKAESTR